MNNLADIDIQLLRQLLVIVHLAVSIAVAHRHEDGAVARDGDAPTLLHGKVLHRQLWHAAIDNRHVMHGVAGLVQHGMGQIGVAVALGKSFEERKIDAVALGEVRRQHDIQQPQGARRC